MDDQNLIMWLDTLKKTIQLGNLEVSVSLIDELESKLAMKGKSKIMSPQEQIDVLRADVEELKVYKKKLEKTRLGNLCKGKDDL